MLLLDENLSPRLIARITDIFPGSLHVIHANLDNSPDIEIWNYAKANRLAIVTKDKDFLLFSAQHGTPPKIVFLDIRNTRVANIEKALLHNASEIQSFLDLEHKAVLTIATQVSRP